MRSYIFLIILLIFVIPTYIVAFYYTNATRKSSTKNLFHFSTLINPNHFNSSHSGIYIIFNLYYIILYYFNSEY